MVNRLFAKPKSPEELTEPLCKLLIFDIFVDTISFSGKLSLVRLQACSKTDSNGYLCNQFYTLRITIEGIIAYLWCVVWLGFEKAQCRLDSRFWNISSITESLSPAPTFGERQPASLMTISLNTSHI